MERYTAFLLKVATLKREWASERIDRATFARRLIDEIHIEAGLGTPADRFTAHVNAALEVAQ